MFVTTTIIAIVTAYNVGVASQTDARPCEGATRKNLCAALARGEKICAVNGYKFGTILDVPGYGKCRVADRKNKRYNKSWIDVAFKANEIQKAKNWGVKNLTIKVL